MLKRILHINLLLLATGFYLAQAILPHHHHDEALICIETTHCEPEEASHLHGPGHHEHENDESDDDCNLERIVVLTGIQKIQKAKQKSDRPIDRSDDAIPIVQLSQVFYHGPNNRLGANKNLPRLNSLFIKLPDLRGPPVF